MLVFSQESPDSRNNPTKGAGAAGQRRDGVIRLYDDNARYYDPAIGRFTQPDTIVPNPADPQSLNRYAYVNNNPVRYTDPSGHDEFGGTKTRTDGRGYPSVFQAPRGGLEPPTKRLTAARSAN